MQSDAVQALYNRLEATETEIHRQGVLKQEIDQINAERARAKEAPLSATLPLPASDPYRPSTSRPSSGTSRSSRHSRHPSDTLDGDTAPAADGDIKRHRSRIFSKAEEDDIDASQLAFDHALDAYEDALLETLHDLSLFYFLFFLLPFGEENLNSEFA